MTSTELSAPGPGAPDTQASAPAIFPLEQSIALFTAFDAAAESESGRAAPADFSESRARISALIDRLPQRDAIEDAHKERWIDRTMRMAVDRMELEHGEGRATVADVHHHVLWHVRRASGIGGSEASTVLKHYEGKRGTFSDAHNLVMEKLLILSPQPSTDEMARGVRAEPWIQRMLHERDGCRSDDEGLKRLRGFRWNRRPASVGTPDDILLLTDGRRRLVDYKAPSADVVKGYDADGISEDYVAQVHHYAILSLAAGARFDDMSIEVLDPRSFTIKRFEVPFDKELARQLASACHRLWHENVMMGVVPDAPRPDQLDILDEAVIRIGTEATMLKVLVEEISKRQADLVTRISTVGSAWHDLATGKLDLGVASFDRARKWKEEELVSLAEMAGVDLEPFRVDAKTTKDGKELDRVAAIRFLRDLHQGLAAGEDVSELLAGFRASGVMITRSLDLEGLAAHLEEHGVDTLPAADVQEKFLMSRKSKGPEAERLIEIRAQVSDLVDGIESMVQETAQRVILGEPSVEEQQAELAELA